MTGPGTNYIWWDDEDPTAKVHEVMADVAQQLISPVRITNLTLLNGSNRLDVANMPIGLNGFVDGSTNLVLANWTTQCKLQQHQRDANDLRPGLRAAVVLSVAFSLRLVLAIIWWGRAARASALGSGTSAGRLGEATLPIRNQTAEAVGFDNFVSAS